MINTLRITGVIAVILAGVLFVFPVIFGVRSDQKVNEFLNAPGTRENFEKAADSKSKNKEDRASPLVQQAEAFALYLNPPKPSFAAAPKDEKASGLPRPMPPTTPKFKVFGTSYCQNNPEMSLALIDEVGRGRHWIRQSGTVGHLIIAQVKDGIVVVKNNGDTYEVPIEKDPALTATTPTSAISTGPMPRDVAMRGRAVPSALAKTPPAATPAVATALPSQSASPEKDAKLQELARQLIDVQRNSASGASGAGLSDAEKQARAQELIAKYREAQRSVRVSPKEAKELGDLGTGLEQTQQGEPNTPAAAAADGKIEGGSSDPNGSAGSGGTP